MQILRDLETSQTSERTGSEIAANLSKHWLSYVSGLSLPALSVDQRSERACKRTKGFTKLDSSSGIDANLAKVKS